VGDDAAEIVLSLGALDVAAHTNTEGKHFSGALQRSHEVGEMERFDQIVIGSGLHRFDGAIDHVIGAHHEDNGSGIGRLHAAQDFDTIDAGENDIEQDQLGVLFFEDAKGIFAGACREYFIAFGPQAAQDGAQG